MLFKNISLLALAACVAAQDIKWTKRASPDQLGLLRRDGNELGYEPETKECDKEGDTCAEACGDGYEQCKSSDEFNHCYNPAAGDVCCEYPGAGTSCEAGYFCAHNKADEKKTLCCKAGSSLDECAATYSLAAGALAEDPPMSTITSTSTINNPTATGYPTPTSSSSAKNGTDTKSPPPAAKGPGSGASSFVPATGLVLVAAVFAALL